MDRDSTESSATVGTGSVKRVVSLWNEVKSSSKVRAVSTKGYFEVSD